jgi:hypothetical protein
VSNILRTANPSTQRRRKIVRYLGLTFAHPQAALAELVADSRGRIFAALALGAVTVLYSLVEWFLYGQHTPVPPPFLRIPSDEYYAWAALFGVPTFVGCWLLATGTMQLLSRALGGQGKFEDLATAVAWATGVATLFTAVPDFTSSALGVYETWDPTGLSWVLFATLYLVTHGVLYISAVRAVHGLQSWLALVISYCTKGSSRFSSDEHGPSLPNLLLGKEDRHARTNKSGNEPFAADEDEKEPLAGVRAGVPL